MPTPIVLVAEDTEGHRTLIDLLLSPQGYELAMVADGREALEWLHDHTPDLAILDVDMPFLDGLEVARRMRALARLREAKIIVLTALRDPATLEGARLIKADALVPKPLAGKDFRDIVAKVLAGERQPF
ncbi:MAG: response regulator [Trueperaceae bacterium]|nr:response regulator [Trueperaceae bacterium]